MAPPGQLPSDALVLFGITGDLAFKKLLPALYRMAADRRLDVPVVGVASSGLDDESLRRHARDAIETFLDAHDAPTDAAVLDSVLSRLSIVTGDYQDPDTFTRLAGALAGFRHPLHYLAIPPALFPRVVSSLASAGLNDGARVVVEKPFGRDRASSAALTCVLDAVFDPGAVFRVDHFLGKNTVEGLMVFRFANMFEPLWSREHIDHVQVTLAESFGVAGRGSFYDSVGTLRDVVQNHLLEVVSLLAMEPPASMEAAALVAEKAKVLAAMSPLTGRDVVRGQYRRYRDEHGVDPASTSETFAAMRLSIDSWRWAGVPFLLRAGKHLPMTATEAVVTFKAPPRNLFGRAAVPNRLRFRLGPDSGIGLELSRRADEDLAPVPVALSIASDDVRRLPQDAYARLLVDALRGRRDRFADPGTVDLAWAVVDGALDVGGVELYEEGSWGPSASDGLASGVGGWIDPQ